MEVFRQQLKDINREERYRATLRHTHINTGKGGNRDKEKGRKTEREREI